MQTTTVTFKLTVEQKNRLKHDAATAKLSLSNYIKVKLGLL